MTRHDDITAAHAAIRKCADDLLIKRAEEKRRDGESVAQALDRLIRERDSATAYFLDPLQQGDDT